MGTVNILFLTSVPENAPALDLNVESRTIEDVLEQSANSERFRLFRHARLRREELEHTLATFQPHIVHFSGHGSSNGALLLEDHDGQRWDLDRSTLRTVFKAYGQSTRLAVLNACHSEVAGNTLREVVPYVIGNAIAVYDDAAIEFAKAFYATLFRGETLYKSFREACRSAAQLDASRGQVPQLLDTPHQLDPRQVKPVEQWVQQKTHDPPPAISTSPDISRSEVRAVLSKHLRLDADLEAFAIERFPDVYQRWSSGMDRVSKVNLLLVLQEPAQIAAALASFLKRAH
jgi:hypothetical protein